MLNNIPSDLPNLMAKPVEFYRCITVGIRTTLQMGFSTVTQKSDSGTVLMLLSRTNYGNISKLSLSSFFIQFLRNH